jgi:predicted NUDIX family NTP pyrophosphohydrolase
MVTKQSAGILLYRQTPQAPSQFPASPPQTPTLEVFLVHPGGPFWKNKDAGSWTIPKGEFDNDEPALDAAIREFREETGFPLKGHFQSLSPIRQKGGKRVFAWALAGDLDATAIVSNTFEIEWPPHSGKQQSFPEVDRGGWFPIAEAKKIINPAQAAFLEELEETIPKIEKPAP